MFSSTRGISVRRDEIKGIQGWSEGYKMMYLDLFSVNTIFRFRVYYDRVL